MEQKKTGINQEVEKNDKEIVSGEVAKINTKGNNSNEGDKESADWKLSLFYMPYKVIRELIYIPYGALVVFNLLIALKVLEIDSRSNLKKLVLEIAQQVDHFKTEFYGHSILPYLAILAVYLIGQASISIAYLLFFINFFWSDKLTITCDMIKCGEDTFKSLYRYSHLHSIRAGLVGSILFSAILFIPFSLGLKLKNIFIIDSILIIAGLLFAMGGAKKVFEFGHNGDKGNNHKDPSLKKFFSKIKWHALFFTKIHL